MISPVHNFVVFDCETTGLVKEKHAIIEIACCAVDFDMNNLKEFETGVMKVYGMREITDGALNANGITRQQIENGKDPKEQIELLCSYLKSLAVGKNKPILVAQNGDKFDIPFIDNMFTFFGKDLSKYVNIDITIDTLWWGRIKWKELTDFKLAQLCSAAGIELVGAHRALNDTRATRDLFKTFIKSLRSEGESKSLEIRHRANFEF